MSKFSIKIVHLPYFKSIYLSIFSISTSKNVHAKSTNKIEWNPFKTRPSLPWDFKGQYLLSCEREAIVCYPLQMWRVPKTIWSQLVFDLLSNFVWIINRVTHIVAYPKRKKNLTIKLKFFYQKTNAYLKRWRTPAAYYSGPLEKRSCINVLNEAAPVRPSASSFISKTTWSNLDEITIFLKNTHSLINWSKTPCDK